MLSRPGFAGGSGQIKAPVKPGLARRANTPTVASNGRGSNKNQTVGAAGFEPALSRPQTERDTRLRHAPMSCCESTATRSAAGRSRPEALTETVSRRFAP